MTLSEIVNAPDDHTFFFEDSRLQDLLGCLADVKMVEGSADEVLRSHGATRVTISPVKNLARRAFEIFSETNTDAPCGYAFGREWFYQNAAGDAPSLVIGDK